MKKVKMSLNLGGGVPGEQPRGGLIGGTAGPTSGSGMEGGQKRGLNRKILRESFGNNSYKYKNSNIFPIINKKLENDVVTEWNTGLTPFRGAMNAGDIFIKFNSPVDKNLYPPPSNQVRINNSSINGWKGLAGKAISINGGAAYSGNPKFVYDGADYTRFKKLQAINKTYNDKSFGGNDSNAQQVAWRRTHRG